MDGGLRDLVDTSYSTFESTDRAIQKGTKKSGCTFLGKGILGGGVGLQLMRGLPPRTIGVMVIPQV